MQTAHGLKDALVFHAVFFAVAIPVALSAHGTALGFALVALALLYNIGLAALGTLRNQADAAWFGLWRFLLPLSMALPCADWMLVERMGTLHFPDHGVARLGGAVPAYFMGMWIMILWPVCWVARHTAKPYTTVAVLSLMGFIVWEWAARPMNLWHAEGVNTVAGFALYPLIPEVLLCLLAYWAWQAFGHAPAWQRIVVAMGIAVFYAGALALALLWVG
ncbi:MAG TPA: hypothetical protein VFV39_03060 [Limnobacter sp.]|nr:hypothetical protein [Limnobacter sp.]